MSGSLQFGAYQAINTISEYHVAVAETACAAIYFSAQSRTDKSDYLHGSGGGHHCSKCMAIATGN